MAACTEEQVKKADSKVWLSFRNWLKFLILWRVSQTSINISWANIVCQTNITLDAGDKTKHNTDKNSCPSGGYFLVEEERQESI